MLAWLINTDRQKSLMKICIQSIERSSLSPKHHFTVATLDIPYYDFIVFDSSVPRPSRKPKPHHEILVLYLTLVRPDGSEIETETSINFVSGSNPPARIHFPHLMPQDAPPGSEIKMFRCEIEKKEAEPIRPANAATRHG